MKVLFLPSVIRLDPEKIRIRKKGKRKRNTEYSSFSLLLFLRQIYFKVYTYRVGANLGIL